MQADYGTGVLAISIVGSDGGPVGDGRSVGGSVGASVGVSVGVSVGEGVEMGSNVGGSASKLIDVLVGSDLAVGDGVSGVPVCSRVRLGSGVTLLNGVGVNVPLGILTRVRRLARSAIISRSTNQAPLALTFKRS